MTYTGTLVRDLQSVVEACLQRYGCREWVVLKNRDFAAEGGVCNCLKRVAGTTGLEPTASAVTV